MSQPLPSRLSGIAPAGATRRFRSRWIAGWVRAAWALVFAAAVWTQAASGPTEYQVKAAFVFNFVQFVDWPAAAFAAAESPLIIGVIGEDPFGPVLDATVKGEKINGRSLAVKRLAANDDPAACHVLFVSRSEQDRVGSLLERLKGAPVLTVSEQDGFARRGGVINFITLENKVRFEINPSAARRAGLSISSKLLNLARNVSSEP